MRERDCAPTPHDFEHVPQSVQLSSSQCTGQFTTRQLCVFVWLPLHVSPPCSSCVTTLRERVCVPAPQLLEHEPKAPQSDHAQ